MSARPKALIVLPTAFKGGAESVSLCLARELSSRGHEVTLYIASRGPQPLADEAAALPRVSVVCETYRSEKLSLPLWLFRVARLARGDYDLVFSTHLLVNAALSLMRRARLLHCGRLVSRESTVSLSRFRGWRRMACKLAYSLAYGGQDVVVLQTEEMYASVRPAIRHWRPRLLVVPNPVDIELIDREVAGTAPLGTKRGAFVIACGRLIPIKNFGSLVEAFAKSERAAYTLEIYGSGPCAGELRDLIEANGLQGAVSLPGHVQSPYGRFARSDVGVVSSVKEGFPNVLLEMMASGVKRVVCTPCASGIDSIPGIYMCRGHSADAIAEALQRAMLSDEDRSPAYRRHVTEFHSPRAFCDQVAGGSPVTGAPERER